MRRLFCWFGRHRWTHYADSRSHIDIRRCRHCSRFEEDEIALGI